MNTGSRRTSMHYTFWNIVIWPWSEYFWGLVLQINCLSFELKELFLHPLYLWHDISRQIPWKIFRSDEQDRNWTSSFLFFCYYHYPHIFFKGIFSGRWLTLSIQFLPTEFSYLTEIPAQIPTDFFFSHKSMTLDVFVYIDSPNDHREKHRFYLSRRW